MRVFRRICAVIYLFAAIVALGGFAAYIFSPLSSALGHQLLHNHVLRIFVAVCLIIAAVGAVGLVIAVFAQKAAPECVHVNGNEKIQVSLSALKHSAESALKDEKDAMVEHINVRVTGTDHSKAQFKIEAIALEENDLEALAKRMQYSVESACVKLVGDGNAIAQVRFLPAKTTTQIREVSGE